MSTNDTIERRGIAVNFQDLMNCYYISEEDNNQIAYDKLVALMRKGNVTPVIGAGISRWAYPLWRDMLEEQAINYGFSQEIKELLDQNRYEAAASFLEQELSHYRFTQLLQRIFRTSLVKEKASQCPECLKLIPKLFRGPVITTNFDRVIEYLFEQNGETHPDIVVPADSFQSEKIRRALHEGHAILVKIHGDIEDPENLVLTEEAYDNNYGSDPFCPDLEFPMPKFLHQLLERNPLLFLGCSLGADRTCAVIKSCASHGQQFAFLELPKETHNDQNPFQPVLRGEDQKIIKELWNRQKSVLGEMNIQPVWYPYHEHTAAFQVFFAQLSEDLKEGRPFFSVLETHRILNKLPQVRDVFYGRDDLIEQIHDRFNLGTRALFLEGVGGIGKSEVIKKYAVQYEKEYKNIIFLTYLSSLKQLVCDESAIQIDHFTRMPEEKDDAFFMRKLHMLQSLTDEKTLILIDNFDVEDDPDLKAFLDGTYRVIFSSRCAHPGYSSIKVDAIRNMDTIFMIFAENYAGYVKKEDKIAENYAGYVKEEDKIYLKEIFDLVDCHTYAVELIAKQMAASYLSAKKMLELLREGQFRAIAPETVAGRDGQNTAFGHICSLFRIDTLSEEEKEIMRYMAVIGIQGITAARFQEWAGISSFETVNHLIKRSWIRREKGKDIFSLHPLVREVVGSELAPDVDNCRKFLHNMTVFCWGAWMRKYTENMEVMNNIQECIEYLGLDSCDVHIFEPCIGFLWQVGKFEDAVRYYHKLYDGCLKKYGEDSMENGIVAKALGGAYFNSGRRKDSIFWYERGLKSIENAGKGDSPELALAYEKVARCYTWAENPKQDLKRAEEYFNKALRMYERIRDLINQGIERKSWISGENYDINLVGADIGEVYMEIGRMYQVAEDYEKALDYAVKYGRSISRYQPQNESGLAYSYYDQGVCCYYLGIREKEKGNGAAALEKWKQAEEKLVQALKINMKMRGALALDTIDNQEYLADVYMAMSEELCHKALDGYVEAKKMTDNLMGENCCKAQSIRKKIQRISG